MLTPSELRELLAYDPTSGALMWLPRVESMFPTPRAVKTWNTRYANKPALTAFDGRGYLHGTIHAVTYAAHRVIWALVHGTWPVCEIDHINGKRCDNRLTNLRAVSSVENGRNRKLRSDNATGVSGVYVGHGKYVATIGVRGLHEYLGLFQTLEEATAARKRAEIEYGYHANHGRL